MNSSSVDLYCKFLRLCCVIFSEFRSGNAWVYAVFDAITVYRLNATLNTFGRDSHKFQLMK